METAISPLVMGGRSLPSSAKAEVNMGTANSMMTMNTMAATISTSTGYVRVLTSLAWVLADLS